MVRKARAARTNGAVYIYIYNYIYTQYIYIYIFCEIKTDIGTVTYFMYLIWNPQGLRSCRSTSEPAEQPSEPDIWPLFQSESARSDCAKQPSA